jgi:membrane protein
MWAKLRAALSVFTQAFWDFLEDDCMSMAAALSFYTMFSLPPLVLIVISIVSLVFPRQQVENEVRSQVNSLIGEQAGENVLAMVRNAQATGPTTAATVLGIGLLVFAATGVLAQLQYSLNMTWEVEPDPEQGGVKNFLLKRVLSLAMLLAIAFLLLVALVVTTALEAFQRQIQAWFVSEAASAIITAANVVLSLVVITFLFSAIYKVLPDAAITWRDVAVGSVVSAVLFVIGKQLIGVYLGNSRVATPYGAASALAVILIWVYYASLILLYGAEFTQVWARRYGRGLHPVRGAVRTVRRKNHVRQGQESPPEKKVPPKGKTDERKA